MKTTKLFIAAISFLLQSPAFAQVEIDHEIQLTGTGTNAKINGIKSVTDSLDAASVKSIQQGRLIYAMSSGSSGNFILNLSPAISVYDTGMVFNFLANQTVTGQATLNINNLGMKAITKNYNLPLSGCEIHNGQIVTVVYDGANFELTSPFFWGTDSAPDTANAGPDQLNVVNTTITLAANTPSIGTGLWSIANGTGGSFSNASSPSGNFTGVGGNAYVLVWTITSSTCGYSNTDTMNVSFSNPPVPETISGLYLWYDANDASTFTFSSGNSVSVWADKSANHFNASNATPSEQPVLTANDINGHPAVRFTGANGNYLVNSVFTMNLLNRSIFIVLKENDANVEYSRWISINGSSSPGNDYDSDNGYLIGSYVSSPSVQACNKCNLGGYNAIAADGGAIQQAPLNIYADIVSDTGTLYVGGVAGATGSNPNAYTSAGGIALGAGYYSGFQPGQLDGDYAELIIYNRALTKTEKDEVGAYLSAKWNIPFTP